MGSDPEVDYDNDIYIKGGKLEEVDKVKNWNELFNYQWQEILSFEPFSDSNPCLCVGVWPHE